MKAPRELDLAALDLTAWIRPGETVIWSQGTAEPTGVIGRLVEQRHELGRPRVFLGSSYADTVTPAHGDALDFIGIGAVGRTQAFLEAGLLDVIPCHLSDLERAIDDGSLNIDVVFVQAAQNANGEFSYGAVNSYLPAAVRRARLVIAEVNELAPWTHSSSPLAAEDIDIVVRHSLALAEVRTRAPGSVDVAIARHTASLIRDGDTLQIGIGMLPDAILGMLHDRRDLGVHSGVIGDGVAALMERGVVTNARKPVDVGVTVTGGLFGSQYLNAFADGNPAMRVDPVSYTHSGSILSRFDALVTVNSAIEVDLTGQVNTEVADGRYLGTIGGQTDFARAAVRSPRGRSIIALPSRTGSRRVPRIVASLSACTVSAARADTDFVVTEHGVAHLRAQPIAERVRRMIAIAHPDDRESLERAAFVIPGMKTGFG